MLDTCQFEEFHSVQTIRQSGHGHRYQNIFCLIPKLANELTGHLMENNQRRPYKSATPEAMLMCFLKKIFKEMTYEAMLCDGYHLTSAGPHSCSISGLYRQIKKSAIYYHIASIYQLKLPPYYNMKTINSQLFHFPVQTRVTYTIAIVHYY